MISRNVMYATSAISLAFISAVALAMLTPRAGSLAFSIFVLSFSLASAYLARSLRGVSRLYAFLIIYSFVYFGALLGAVLGLTIGMNSPELGVIQEVFKEISVIVESHDVASMTSMIFLHNIRVLLMDSVPVFGAFVLGASLGVTSCLLGLVGAWRGQPLRAILTLLYPHSLLEVAAYCIAATIAVNYKGLRDAALTLALAVAVLVLAAVVETTTIILVKG